MTDITDYIRLHSTEPFQPVTALQALFRLWHRRIHNRAFLQRASRHELADMGLSPWQCECEANKPFWQA